MTKMLLTVSIMFIILTLPNSIYFLWQGTRLVGEPSAHLSAVVQLLYASTLLLLYTNNSINFLLYCISGSQFRREVFSLFRPHN
jgi:hypothetical protein